MSSAQFFLKLFFAHIFAWKIKRCERRVKRRKTKHQTWNNKQKSKEIACRFQFKLQTYPVIRYFIFQLSLLDAIIDVFLFLPLFVFGCCWSLKVMLLLPIFRVIEIFLKVTLVSVFFFHNSGKCVDANFEMAPVASFVKIILKIL